MVSYEEFVRFLEATPVTGNSAQTKVANQSPQQTTPQPQATQQTQTQSTPQPKQNHSAQYKWVTSSKWYKDYINNNKGKLPANFESRFQTKLEQAIQSSIANKNNTPLKVAGDKVTFADGFIKENQEALNKLVQDSSTFTGPAPLTSEDLNNQAYSNYAQKAVNEYINNPANKVTVSADEFTAKFKEIFNNHLRNDIPKAPVREEYSEGEAGDRDFEAAKKQHDADVAQFYKELPQWISKTLPTVEGQSSEGAPGKTNTQLNNSEFDKVSKEEINKIGHTEIAKHTEDIKKAFNDDLRKGITKIEYIDITGGVQESKKISLGSRIQEFKKLKEDAPVNTATQTSQPKETPQQAQPGTQSAQPQGNPQDPKTAEMIKKLSGVFNDKPITKLELPQTMTFRISFAPDTMYWILRSYGEIGEKFALLEAAEERIKGLEKEGKLESLNGTPEYSTIMREAESYLSLLLEDTAEDIKAQKKADKEAAKLAKEVKKDNKKVLNSVKKNADSSEEKKSLTLKDIKIDEKTEAKTKYFIQFEESVERAKEGIVKHLQEEREEEVAKRPKEQQPYVPNYELAEDDSKEYSYFGNEDLIKELKEIEKVVKETPLEEPLRTVKETVKEEEGEEEGEKEEIEKVVGGLSADSLANATKKLAPLKEKILQLSKDPNNCQVDIKVDMIPWNKKPKKPKTKVTVNKNLMNVSKSAQKWSKVFSGK